MNLPPAMLFFIFRFLPKLGQAVLGEGGSAPLITRPYRHRNSISKRYTVPAVSSSSEQDEAVMTHHDHPPGCYIPSG
ncbi:uncharacterized [Tachysurus ichikawai]